MTKAILIEVSGNVRRVEINSYDDLNRIVGGYIEGIYLGETGHFAYLNEDGIALGLPMNRLATELCYRWNVGLIPGDYIKGSMVIVGPADDDGNETDVSEAFAASLGL